MSEKGKRSPLKKKPQIVKIPILQVLVYLLGFSVLPKQTSQDSHASDPDDFLRHPGIGRTLPLAVAHVSTLPPGLGILPDASPGMDFDRFANDQTILDEFADILS